MLIILYPFLQIIQTYGSFFDGLNPYGIIESVEINSDSKNQRIKKVFLISVLCYIVIFQIGFIH